MAPQLKCFLSGAISGGKTDVSNLPHLSGFLLRVIKPAFSQQNGDFNRSLGHAADIRLDLNCK